jgi:hypothetical protein
MMRYVLLISVSFLIYAGGISTSTTHDVIFFHLCFCRLANEAFAVKTNDGINFQLLGISSNFAENVWFNQGLLEPSGTEERC